MEKVRMFEYAGEFGENKDVAKKIRQEILVPALAENKAVTFDFEDVTGVTQSFMHALISDAIRQYPDVVFDNVFFKDANEEIRQIVEIVYSYMQESL